MQQIKTEEFEDLCVSLYVLQLILNKILNIYATEPL